MLRVDGCFSASSVRVGKLARGLVISALLLALPAVARGQTPADDDLVAGAEIRWQQRHPGIATLQWQPWTPWERRPGWYSGEQRRAWSRQRSLRPYWSYRWSRRWSDPRTANRQGPFNAWRDYRPPYGDSRNRAAIDRYDGWRAADGRGYATSGITRDRIDRYARRAPW